MKARALRPRLASADFDHPIEIRDPQSEKTSEKKVADELRDMLVKVLPFLVVMWMLTGSIHPAIDMTAGEKERGTMETLLISPAERTEIVIGKFFATACFGFGTSLWNVLLMVVAVVIAPLLAPNLFGHGLISLSGARGVYSGRDSAGAAVRGHGSVAGHFRPQHEGGELLHGPAILRAALPLAYWSMTPGIELDRFTSWVPMANALLLQQRLMSERPDPFPWQHIPAVFISLTACVLAGVSGRPSGSSTRESVLFREAAGRWPEVVAVRPEMMPFALAGEA